MTIETAQKGEDGLESKVPDEAVNVIAQATKALRKLVAK